MFKVPLRLLASIAVLTVGVAGTAYAGGANAIDLTIPLFHVTTGGHASSVASSVLTAINGQTPGPNFGVKTVAPMATQNSQGSIASGGIGGFSRRH
jgi:hypothetical protein